MAPWLVLLLPWPVLAFELTDNGDSMIMKAIMSQIVISLQRDYKQATEIRNTDKTRVKEVSSRGSLPSEVFLDNWIRIIKKWQRFSKQEKKARGRKGWRRLSRKATTWISKTEEEGQRRQPGKADKEKLLDAGAIAEPEAKKTNLLGSTLHWLNKTQLGQIGLNYIGLESTIPRTVHVIIDIFIVPESDHWLCLSVTD